jgi:hypothetical protein
VLRATSEAARRARCTLDPRIDAGIDARAAARTPVAHASATPRGGTSAATAGVVLHRRRGTAGTDREEDDNSEPTTKHGDSGMKEET